MKNTPKDIGLLCIGFAVGFILIIITAVVATWLFNLFVI